MLKQAVEDAEHLVRVVGPVSPYPAATMHVLDGPVEVSVAAQSRGSICSRKSRSIGVICCERRGTESRHECGTAIE